MLMDLQTLEWHKPTLELFDIREEWLPRIVKSNSADFGTFFIESTLSQLRKVKIGGAIGD